MNVHSSPSADSGSNSKSNSKRSLSDSNPSSSYNGNKKKKTNQKTLGVAWGANSRSSTRSTFRSAPFSDFGSYMVVKNQKLHEQFDAEASGSSHSGSSSGKAIFHGVSIFVDGYTVPTSQELRGYMLKYGGRFENYFSRHRVTHIICSNLPDSKIKNLRSFSGGLPVVKPTWVLDSVAANKLLSWIPYQIDQLANKVHNQPKLSSFFTLKSSMVSDCAETSATDQEISGSESPKVGTNDDANHAEECESTHEAESRRVERDDPVHMNLALSLVEEPNCGRQNCDDWRTTESSAADIPQDSTSFSHDCQGDGEAGKEPSGPKPSKPSIQRHSTLGDCNFVENYFKSSRLHFIGTWRNRYRKRFPGVSTGFKLSCSSNASASSSTIIHVDMDCFFVSVITRKYPGMRDKPVAVCHSDNPRGTAEISSANYPARDHGVKAGMFVRDAKALCPNLAIVPYDFEAYEEIADQFYDILHKHCNKVQAVSCDEAFLDVTDSGIDPEHLASNIRKEVVDTTGCTASAGISGNMLLARLATRSAKPDGQFYITSEKVDDYLNELPVKALPGIGYVLEEKLKRRHIRTCGQLRMISKESLQKDFGMKTGEMLWNYSRGIDSRMIGVIQESKSIGAEVNWGVRFNNLNDTRNFLEKLCKEVSLRLHGCAMQGRTFTLKIKKRKDDAGEPVKFMGCGACENLSHSVTVPMATDDPDVLQRIATQLFGSFNIDVKDIRGVGLQVSKLENADRTKQGHERTSIRSWLVSSSKKTKDTNNIISNRANSIDSGSRQDDGKPGTHYANGKGQLVQAAAGLSSPSTSEAGISRDTNLPPLDDLDMGVIESLPAEVFMEINDMYGGKLGSLMAKYKDGNTSSKTLSASPVELAEEVKDKEKGTSVASLAKPEKISSSDEGKQPAEEKIQMVAGPGTETSNVMYPTVDPQNMGLMPSSLSQVDSSVLQQLPDDLRSDILEMLPAHRMHSTSICSLNTSEYHCVVGDSHLRHELWVGDPPRWISDFKACSCRTLKAFAEKYFKTGSTGQLSFVLQSILSEVCSIRDAEGDDWDDAVNSLNELFKQYVKLKVETDIEEIFLCSCLMKRLSSRSVFYEQVYNSVLPHIQAAVGENYGGNLRIPFVKD